MYCRCKGGVVSELFVKCDGDQECPNGSWLHPQCTSDLCEKSKEELDAIEEWYCEDCIARIQRENDEQNQGYIEEEDIELNLEEEEDEHVQDEEEDDLEINLDEEEEEDEIDQELQELEKEQKQLMIEEQQASALEIQIDIE